MKSKITAVIAAAYIASVMSFAAYASGNDGISGAVEDVGEGAGGVIDSIGDGIEDVADGIGSAADDVLDGAGNAVDSVTGGDDEIVNDDGDEEPIDDGVADVTDDDDVADVDDDTEVNDNPTFGKDDMYEAEIDSDKNDIDPNPATGDLSLMTAAAFAGVAAGVAYLTKKSRAED